MAAAHREAGVLDTAGMFDLALGLGDQMAASAQRASAGVASLADRRPRAMVVAGMGGSGVAGDILQALAGPVSPVPVSVTRHYELPVWVGADDLVAVVSYSGDTEEALECAGSALDRGASVVGVTQGGRLGTLLGDAGGTVLPVDPSIPWPRAGVGASSVPLLLLAGRVGILPSADSLVEEAVAQVRARAEALDRPVNPARALARHLERTQPLIYGGGVLGEVAARRLKNQVNENAKAPAYSCSMPELCHNEICGWGQHGDVTRQVNSLILLRHDHEHPRLAARYEYVRQVCDEVVAGIHELRAEGEGPAAQLFDLILLGDLVSLWMAAEAGVDPGPVPTLTDLKAFLADG